MADQSNTSSLKGVSKKARLAHLRAQIADLEAEMTDEKTDELVNGLLLSEYRQYGRQMILDKFGLEGTKVACCDQK